MSYSIPFGESFVLLILFQYVKTKRKTKTPLLGILMSGLALLSLTILNIGLLGSEVCFRIKSFSWPFTLN